MNHVENPQEVRLAGEVSNPDLMRWVNEQKVKMKIGVSLMSLKSRPHEMGQ